MVPKGKTQQQRRSKMIIKNTNKSHEILLTYHNGVSGFYKQLSKTDEIINDLVIEWNKLTKPGFGFTNQDMHHMLLKSKFVREDHSMYCELWGDMEHWGDYRDVLVSDLVLCSDDKLDENQRVYLMKGSVYMTMPNYMTISGNTEYLEITHGSNFDDLVSELTKLKHRISYTH